MNRRAPELALLAGLLLSLSIGGFAFWATGELTPSLLTGAVLCYPFARYAVVHDDDPTTVLPPRAVGLFGVLAGTLLVFDSLATGPSPAANPVAALLRGLFLGSLVALPPAAYAVARGASVSDVPPRPVFAAALAFGLLLVVAGALAETAFGAAAGGLLALAGGLYARERGYRPNHDARLAGVGGGVIVGGALVVFGLARDEAVLASVLAAVGVVLAPGVYYALTVDSASFE